MYFSKKSFTLIELIVTMGIITLSLPLIFSLFFIILQQQSKIYILQEVKRNGDYALNIIQSTIRQFGKKVVDSNNNEICTSDNSSQIYSQIYLVDKYGGTFTYFLDNNKIASQSSRFPQTWYLTNEKVKVENLNFSCTKTNQFSPPLITVSFTISQAGTPSRHEEKASMTYQTKIKLRSY